VTEADIAIDRVLRTDLRAARPDYGWLSEETEDDAERLSAQRSFVVDPIDGTRAFIEGQTSFAHSLAVVDGGDVVAGVVYLPMEDKLYAAAKGHGATLNDAPIRVSETNDLEQASALVTRPNVQPSPLEGRRAAVSPRLPPLHRLPAGPCGGGTVRPDADISRYVGMGHRRRCDPDRGGRGNGERRRHGGDRVQRKESDGARDRGRAGPLHRSLLRYRLGA
jgi:hypothetical protein